MIECLYDAFVSASGNTENYVDYLELENFAYKPRRKTFDQVYRDIVNCCANLSERGIGTDTVVAFEIENTYKCLICDSALIMLGARAVISRKNDNADVLDQRISEFSAEYLISDRKVSGGIPCFTAEELCEKNENGKLPERHIYNDDMSIMFSSGTTGIPKALGITEKGSVWSSNNFFRFMKFNSGDKFLIFMPLSNYQQRFLFWGCIMNKVNASIGNDMNLLQCLTHLEPSILLAPPNFFYNLYCQQQKTEKDVIRASLGKNMRYLLTGMAPIDNEILWFFHESGNDIYQIYGQTEVGMICCNTVDENRIGTVGKPIIDICFSDEGELITNSPAPIVSGYYENGRLLSPMPFRRPTGDMGIADEDGFVCIKGRINDTIVLRSGKKINPAMIENKIKNLVSDSEAAIYKTKDSSSFNINITIISESFDGRNTDEIRDKVCRLREIQELTDPYTIEFYEADKTDMSRFYTENGKFSRKKAIDILCSSER